MDETIYKRDLVGFKGHSFSRFRFRQFTRKFGWLFIVPAILLMPFRSKNKKAISVLGMLSVSALSMHPLFS